MGQGTCLKRPPSVRTFVISKHPKYGYLRSQVIKIIDEDHVKVFSSDYGAVMFGKWEEMCLVTNDVMMSLKNIPPIVSSMHASCCEASAC